MARFARLLSLVVLLFSTCTPQTVFAQDSNRKTIPRLEVSDAFRPPVRSSCSQLSNKLPGDICWNTVDQLLYTWTGSAWISVGTVTNGSFSVHGSSVCLEGETVDGVTTCISVSEPTRNNIITLSNDTGTAALLNDSGAQNVGDLRVTGIVTAPSVVSTGGIDGAHYIAVSDNTAGLTGTLFPGATALYTNDVNLTGNGRLHLQNATEGTMTFAVSAHLPSDGPAAWASEGMTCIAACIHLLGYDARCNGYIPLDGTNTHDIDCTVDTGGRICECY